MEKRTIELYEFSELSEEAKAKAIEKYRHTNVFDDVWNEHILDDWKAKLEKMGYEDVKILYSGFGSQGDGACFTAESINIPVLLTELTGLKGRELTKKWGRVIKAYGGLDVTGKIVHTWRYYYASSTDVQVYSYGYNEKLDEMAMELAELIEAHREKLGNAIYDELRKDYYRQTSDSAVAEAITEEGYEFLKDGRTFRA